MLIVCFTKVRMMGWTPKKEKKSWVAPRPKVWNRTSYSPELTRFYNSQAWRKTSKRNLAKNPTCVECAKENIVRKADVTDHIIPVRQCGSKLDSRNHQSLCHPHHNAKSSAERSGDIAPYRMISSGKIPYDKQIKKEKARRHI